MKRKFKVLSFILVMALFIMSYMPASVVQASEICNSETANNAASVKIKSFYSDGYLSGAISTTGDLYCWGNNICGNVGNGTTDNQLTPVKVLDNVREFYIGDFVTAAITINGDLYCWGDNECGGVGNGTTDDQLTPVKIFEDVSDVSISSENIAAIKNNGDLYCWGFNRFGQVGNGTTADQLTPVRVLKNVSKFSYYGFTSTALTTNGELYLWGENENGGLGNGTTADQLTPVKVLDNVKDFLYSYDGRVSALTTTGDLYCWGYNSRGQVGNGSYINQLTPVKVLNNVKEFFSNSETTIALTVTGDLYCWGTNKLGTVGNGSYINQLTPVKILENVKEVSINNYTTSAITVTGDLYCWGYNEYGIVGNGTREEQKTPYKVSFPTEDSYSGNLKGLSLSLSDDIGLNLVMQLSDSLLIDKDNTYVEFTPEGSKKSTRVYLKDADKVNYNGSDCYSFKCMVNAAEMTKKVNAVLHCNDWTGQTYSYSVYDYASKILAEPESSEYRSSAPLIKAMLNYGGYAQTYFNEKTDALANKGLYNKTNDPVLTTNTTISKDYNYAAFNNNMGVSFLGGSLVLNSGTDLKLYYSMDDKNMANNIKVSVNGQNIAPEYDGNIMCVRVSDISISSLGDTYNVKISVNGKEINQKYSAMTYMYKALNSQNSNTKLNNVVKALYLYNEAAKQYSMGIE